MDCILSKCFGVSTMSSIMQNLSLFIPYVFLNITEDRISRVFENNHLGVVDYVDFVRKTDKNGKPYNAVYVHFSHWFNSSAVENFQERVLNPDKEARVVYDDPWYWIVLQNTGAKVDGPKAEETEFVSSDYAAILEKKLTESEKRLSELEESSWQRIAELEERVLVLEQERGLYDDMPPLIQAEDEQN
jgi:hypothetical protein